jgi:hypothetical protein
MTTTNANATDVSSKTNGPDHVSTPITNNITNALRVYAASTMEALIYNNHKAVFVVRSIASERLADLLRSFQIQSIDNNTIITSSSDTKQTERAVERPRNSDPAHDEDLELLFPPSHSHAQRHDHDADANIPPTHIDDIDATRRKRILYDDNTTPRNASAPADLVLLPSSARYATLSQCMAIVQNIVAILA